MKFLHIFLLIKQGMSITKYYSRDFYVTLVMDWGPDPLVKLPTHLKIQTIAICCRWFPLYRISTAYFFRFMNFPSCFYFELAPLPVVVKCVVQVTVSVYLGITMRCCDWYSLCTTFFPRYLFSLRWSKHINTTQLGDVFKQLTCFSLRSHRSLSQV